MKRRVAARATWLRLVAAAILLAAASAATAAPAVPASPSHAKNKGAAKVATVTLAIRHRVFHQFSDEQKVRVGQDFVVGDTEFSGRVVRYVPDFAMDMKTGKVVSRSDEPRNPAFQIIVREKGVPQDTTWALLNMPPHFAQKSMLAFKIARIDFVGRDPILPDTTSAPAMPAMPPHGAGMTGGHPTGFPMPPGMTTHPPIAPPSSTAGKTSSQPAEPKSK